tara:strand:+ start:27457 stop:27729 length:273 start_codon:yes stop_codon:yes gene_type:complete
MALNDTITAMERFSSVTITDELNGEVMTLRMAEFIEAITMQVNQNITAVGTGSPEGVLVAEPRKLYIDTAAENIYYKKTGSGNTGWALTT